jgi:hypothetical protein
MEEKENTPKYHVYDRQTGERANNTEYKSRMGARRARDKLDNEYGGYRYHVKPAETSTGGGRGGMGGGGGGMNPIDLERVPGKRPLKMKAGGSVKSSASKRADGIAVKGKTRGKMVLGKKRVHSCAQQVSRRIHTRLGSCCHDNT